LEFYMPNIIVVGSLNMDLVVRAPRHPQPGETIIGSDFATFPGGKGANQAVAAARLGATVKMIGCVGNDAFGNELLQNLDADRVDRTLVRRDAAATGVALITLDAHGQNTIVVAAGANAALSTADIAAAEAVFPGAAVVVLQLETSMAAVQQAIELAKRHAVPVILNPAPAQVVSPELLSQVDYLIPNQFELALVTGEQDMATGVAKLHASGVGCVIVTLGGDGLFASSTHGEIRLPAHQVQVVDTVAAGDAFVGGFAVGVAEGMQLAEALAFGNATAAIAVTRKGAQPSLPTRVEVEEALKR
jgi:ribokinase